MQSFDLNELSEQFRSVNDTVQEFASGLVRLAEHWNGPEGVKTIYARVQHNLNNGIPMEESLIEAYQLLRQKLL